MFVFGMLKFINPFKAWYTAQVINSEVPFTYLSYWAGQLGEIAVGLALIILLLKNTTLTTKTKQLLFYGGNLLIVCMMIGAIHIHNHPNVPADVLPLKIKAPYIPGLFLVLALGNVFLGRKGNKNSL